MRQELEYDVAELLSTLRPKHQRLGSVEEATEALAQLQLREEGGAGAAEGRAEGEGEAEAEAGAVGENDGHGGENLPAEN